MRRRRAAATGGVPPSRVGGHRVPHRLRIRSKGSRRSLCWQHGSAHSRTHRHTSRNHRTQVANPPACWITADRPAPLPQPKRPRAFSSLRGTWSQLLAAASSSSSRSQVGEAAASAAVGCGKGPSSVSPACPWVVTSIRSRQHVAGGAAAAAPAPVACRAIARRHSLPLPHACTHVGWCRHGVHAQRIRGAAWRRCTRCE